MQIHYPLPGQRGQDRRILASLPSACGRPCAQIRGICTRGCPTAAGRTQIHCPLPRRIDADPLPAAEATGIDADPLPAAEATGIDADPLPAAEATRGQDRTHVYIPLRKCIEWVGCRWSGQYYAILPALPGSAQWIHVHARRLGSEAFRTVTGRQLPLA